ncbi:hypothetical protein BLX88_05515 [Bacillus obstructivus]|nr:hypothetical protein BLX88_05515 [Bacillus obstructivus]
MVSLLEGILRQIQNIKVNNIKSSGGLNYGRYVLLRGIINAKSKFRLAQRLGLMEKQFNTKDIIYMQ